MYPGSIVLSYSYMNSDLYITYWTFCLLKNFSCIQFWGKYFLTTSPENYYLMEKNKVSKHAIIDKGILNFYQNLSKTLPDICSRQDEKECVWLIFCLWFDFCLVDLVNVILQDYHACYTETFLLDMTTIFIKAPFSTWKSFQTSSTVV